MERFNGRQLREGFTDRCWLFRARFITGSAPVARLFNSSPRLFNASCRSTVGIRKSSRRCAATKREEKEEERCITSSGNRYFFSHVEFSESPAFPTMEFLVSFDPLDCILTVIMTILVSSSIMYIPNFLIMSVPCKIPMQEYRCLDKKKERRDEVRRYTRG